MILHRLAFRPLVKCFNPLPFPRFSAFLVSNQRLRLTASAVPSFRNVFSTALNTPDNRTKSNITPKSDVPGKELEPLEPGTKLVGQSGLLYQIDRMLQHRTDPEFSCVYLATCEHPENIMIYLC